MEKVDSWGFEISKNENTNDFYKLGVGEHKMRIMTQPTPVRSYYKDGAYTHVDADYKGEEKVSLKGWAWAAIRGEADLKIVTLPYSVISLIQQLRSNDEYAFDEFPMPYDITINATGEKLDREYTVTAARKNTPVTADELSALTLKTPVADIIKKIRDKKEGKAPETKVMPEPTEEINITDIPF